ncbi:RNA polymerase sigma factor [Flagellimonas sp.]|uniref:RNA polymerase sigma factor n=1 Tax=Flagellimonas sp. TaxID=2058762 RepID=UPI003BB11F79
MNEKLLIAKLKQGDVSAYEYLFKEYYDWLCNYIFQLSGNRSLSKDLVQEVILKFWEKRDQIVIKGSLKGYLFRSCHNQFLMHVRKEKTRPDLLDRVRWEVIYNGYTEQKEEDMPMRPVMEKLEELIDKLPPKCKEIFIMNKLERRKYREIAEDMGISVKTVENQMSKALRIIRENASVLLL